ncbi:amidase [Paenibacillus hamazuiensis]|uniref:amidase n=1 Tax=Paenibacillus hamazuiensis TaxID=2936508 RepID=UPI00200D46A1|nr:amidase [Paenibacillus hamazuiensis]
MANNWNAYIDEHLFVGPDGHGELENLTFAVKDVIAVKGHVNAAGNPDWLATHEPARQHAAAVNRLLQAGARLRGATHTDELMFSLNGENHHYGTPVNPRAAGCIPGGSSSGSAVAVAAELADFALGTDTGGSVRIPSAYCGLYGIRPTHGLIPVSGVIPLAASFDTVGWMARDADTLWKVGIALLGREAAHPGGGFRRLFVATDAWDVADPSCREALLRPLRVLEDETVCSRIELAPRGLADWVNTFRTLQGYEIWSAHGEWIRKHRPRFGPGIAERFEWTGTLTKSDYDRLVPVRKSIKDSLANMLGDDGLLVIPTAPCTAPSIGLASDIIEGMRARVMKLSCIACLGGLPQVTMPFYQADGLPVGLSFIAAPYQDAKLLSWIRNAAVRLEKSEAVAEQEKQR